MICDVIHVQRHCKSLEIIRVVLYVWVSYPIKIGFFTSQSVFFLISGPGARWGAKDVLWQGRQLADVAGDNCGFVAPTNQGRFGIWSLPSQSQWPGICDIHKGHGQLVSCYPFDMRTETAKPRCSRKSCLTQRRGCAESRVSLFDSSVLPHIWYCWSEALGLQLFVALQQYKDFQEEPEPGFKRLAPARQVDIFFKWQFTVRLNLSFKIWHRVSVVGEGLFSNARILLRESRTPM